MKKVSKIAAILITCATMVSCKDTVKKDFIESCSRENAEIKATVEQMRTDLKEHEVTNNKLSATYTAVAFVNTKSTTTDVNMKNNIESRQKGVSSEAMRYSQLTDSLNNIVADNDRLIASFNSEQPEQKVANEKWNNNKKSANKLKEKADQTLQNMKEQEKVLAELYAKVSAPAPKKTAKKSKR